MKINAETHLLGCPWCGPEYRDVLEIKQKKSLAREIGRIYCPMCGTMGPEGDTREEAIATWNAQLRTHDEYLLGSLLDAWEGLSTDTRETLRMDAEAFVNLVEKIRREVDDDLP